MVLVERPKTNEEFTSREKIRKWETGKKLWFDQINLLHLDFLPSQSPFARHLRVLGPNNVYLELHSNVMVELNVLALPVILPFRSFFRGEHCIPIYKILKILSRPCYYY